MYFDDRIKFYFPCQFFMHDLFFDSLLNCSDQEQKSFFIDKKIKHEVNVGGVVIGGNNPVVIQSMTSGIRSDQTDVLKIAEDEARESIELAEDSELIRIALNNENAALAIPYIREKMNEAGYHHVPIVGCGQYEVASLLRKHPDCAKHLAKIRINPGNIEFGRKRDKNFESTIEFIRDNEYYGHDNKYPMCVRIGVNWGSLDKNVAQHFMDDNAKLKNPQPYEIVLRKALVYSAISSAKKAEDLGLSPERIIISCKVSRVQDMIAVYKHISGISKYALHLGLTEAGHGLKGNVSTTAALSYLLLEGIGDTIRASLTTMPGQQRKNEALLCKQILQSLGLRSFEPQLTSCPGCGRTKGDRYQKMALEISEYLNHKKKIWCNKNHGVENMQVAVMGCVVNGPGESKHADIAISLPGYGEKDVAAVFVEGKVFGTLRGDNIAEEFKGIIDKYVEDKYPA